MKREKTRVCMSLRNLLSKRILLFLAIGLAVFVAYLYFYVGTTNVLGVLSKANIYYYTSAFAAFLLAIFFSALAWRSLLCNLSVETTIKRAFFFTWVGLFFDATVPEPGFSGDLSKAYMLAKITKVQPGRTVASVVSQKIIGMVITVIDLILGLTLLAFNYKLPPTALPFIAFVLIVSILAVFIVIYVSTRPRATKKLLSWLTGFLSFFLRSRWDSAAFKRDGEETLSRFHESIGELTGERKALTKPIVFALLSWGFDVSVVFLVFAALGSPVPVDKVLIVYALTGTLQSIGISFVGFTDVIISGSYQVLSIGKALSFSATLLTRIITLWFKLVVSYVAFQWAGVRMLLDKTPRRLPEK
jgi:uncharacterized protein (TIRG00374 family)